MISVRVKLADETCEFFSAHPSNSRRIVVVSECFDLLTGPIDLAQKIIRHDATRHLIPPSFIRTGRRVSHWCVVCLLVCVRSSF